MLSDILESPFSPPEMILLNVLKCKAKVELYGRMMDFTENVETEKCKYPITRLIGNFDE